MATKKFEVRPVDVGSATRDELVRAINELVDVVNFMLANIQPLDKMYSNKNRDEKRPV